jgi:hypothetical protein
VRVIDEQSQRPRARHVRAQPVKTVKTWIDRVSTARIADLLMRIDQRSRELGRAREPLASLLLARFRGQLVKQLPHHTKLESLLELGPAGRADAHPGLASELASGRDQAGLADPGGTRDHHHAADAVPQMIDRALQMRDLELTLQERLRRRGHGAILRTARQVVPGEGEALRETYRGPLMRRRDRSEKMLLVA